MILMIAAAVLGAALGLFVRPWWLAPAIAMALGGAVQGALMFTARQLDAESERGGLAAMLDQMAGTGLSSLWPTLAAAGVAASLSALLCAMADGDRRRAKFWMPSDADAVRVRGKDGRRRRLPGMVEDREDIQGKAEGRIQAILDL